MKQATKYQEIIPILASYVESAYAPYSHFKVACALVFKEEVIYGLNVENASYGLTICAERSCLVNAIAKQKNLDDALAMIVYHKESVITSCGACRQVMAELLNAQLPIIFASDEEAFETTVAALLPLSFTKEDLQ